MAKSIMSCEGAGSPWLLEADGEPTEPTCSGCGLTNKELGIKVTTRTKNGVKTPNPTTVPEHEIEVEGQVLKFHLGIDGDFHIHTQTCPTLQRELKTSNYETAQILAAVSRRDAVLQLWDDQIREDQDIADPDDPTEPELNGYYHATDFHRCVVKLEGFEATTKGKANGTSLRDSKHMLATLLVEAMAAEISRILDSNLAGTAEDEAEARTVLSGMSNELIWKTASHWIHHFPADRNRWVASGMPAPDRSDWADFVAAVQEAADDRTQEDTDDEDDTEEE